MIFFILTFPCDKVDCIGRWGWKHIILSQDLILNGKQIVLMNLYVHLVGFPIRGEFFLTLELNASWGPF